MPLSIVFLFTALLAAGPAAAQAQAQRAPRTPDVIFVPTPHEVVEDMLRLVDVKKGDVLYDLGSGDGRIPIAAAKMYGVRAVGIDIDPARIAEAQENAKKAGDITVCQTCKECFEQRKACIDEILKSDSAKRLIVAGPGTGQHQRPRAGGEGVSEAVGDGPGRGSALVQEARTAHGGSPQSPG